MFIRIRHASRLLISLTFVLLLGSGCNLIYKQNIQQGNALEEEDLQQLYIGMNKRQVLFVLGSPSIHDPFQQQRWDYVQTYSRRGEPMVQRTVTLRFENDLLSEIIGVDQTPTALVDEEPEDSVEVSGPGTPQDPTAPDSETAAAEVKAEEKLLPEADVQGIGVPSAQERQFEEQGDDEVMKEEQDLEYEQDEELELQRSPDDLTSPEIDG